MAPLLIILYSFLSRVVLNLQIRITRPVQSWMRLDCETHRILIVGGFIATINLTFGGGCPRLGVVLGSSPRGTESGWFGRASSGIGVFPSALQSWGNHGSHVLCWTRSAGFLTADPRSRSLPAPPAMCSGLGLFESSCSSTLHVVGLCLADGCQKDQGQVLGHF